MTKELRVGNLWRLKSECLGNPAGTVGVCYEVYEIGEHAGFSLIFPNGSYDGFGVGTCAPMFLIGQPVGFCEEVAGYQFTNVIQLGRDFDSGVFAKAMEMAAQLDVEVPADHRLLDVGEIICSGDQWLRPNAGWQSVNHTGGRWNPIGFWPCIRKKTKS